MIKQMSVGVIASILLASNLNAKDVYASVDGVNITKTDIAMTVRDPRVNFDNLPKETQDRIIEQSIDIKLLSLKAKAEGIESTKEFKDELNRIKQDLGYQLWLRNEFKLVTVSGKEISDYYNQNSSQFRKDKQFKARHILVKTEQEANDLIEILKKAPNQLVTFKDLAKTKSTGPSGKTGGDLGWFEGKKMVPEFSEALKTMKINSFSKVVKTQFGYHIIYLEDTKEAELKTISMVENQIKQTLSQQKFTKQLKEMVENLRKKAIIKIK